MPRVAVAAVVAVLVVVVAQRLGVAEAELPGGGAGGVISSITGGTPGGLVGGTGGNYIGSGAGGLGGGNGTNNAPGGAGEVALPIVTYDNAGSLSFDFVGVGGGGGGGGGGYNGAAASGTAGTLLLQGASQLTVQQAMLVGGGGGGGAGAGLSFNAPGGSGGSGTVDLSDSAELTVNGTLLIGGSGGGGSGRRAGGAGGFGTVNSATSTTISATTLQVGGHAGDNGSFAGGGAGGQGILNLSGAVNAGTFTINSNGTLNFGNATSGTATAGTISGISNLTNDGRINFNQSNSAYTFSTVIAGSGSVAIASSGTTTLSGNNTYSGGTLLNSGKLAIGNNNALGTGTLTVSGGILSTNGSVKTLANDISVNGNFSVDPKGSLATIGTAFALNGNMNLNGATRTITTVADLANFEFGLVRLGGVISNGGLTLRAAREAADNAVFFELAGSGSNTHTGLTTVGSSVSLTLAKTGGATAIAGDLLIEDNAVAVSSRDEQIANTATVTVNGIGKLNIGFNSAVTETIGSLMGNGNVLLHNTGGTLAVGAGNFSGAISGGQAGDESLVKVGSGTLILSGGNTYIGSTTIDAGTLQVGNGGATGVLGSADVLNNGTLTFNRSNTFTVANTITGIGDLVKAGAGTLTLTGINTYGGGTTIDAGRINFSTLANLGTGNIILNGGGLQWASGSTADISSRAVSFGSNGGTLDTNGNTIGLAGSMGGTGGLVKSGTGTLILTGTNTYDGTTTISAGTLQVGAGGTTGTLGDGAVANNSTLAFNRSNALMVANSISGNGKITKAGAGTLTLTGTNTYTGGTRVSAGTLQVGAGGTSGSVVGNIVNNSALAFNRSNQLVYAGDISGSGALAKYGAGKLILNGQSIVSGGTTVSAGSLIVGGAASNDDASLKSNVTVKSGATLGGHGDIIGNITVQKGGILKPGNSIGTLSVTGDVSFAADSTYSVDVNAAGQSDKLIVDGKIDIDPSAKLAIIAENGTWSPSTKYKFFTATDGVDGKFGSVTSNLAFLLPNLTYGPNEIELTVTRNDVSFDSVAHSANQKATAKVVQGMPSSRLYSDVVALSANQARAAFDALSGTQHAASSQIAMSLGRNFSGALMNRAAVAGGRFGDASSLRYASLNLSGVSSWQGLFASPHQLGRTLAPTVDSSASPLARFNAVGDSASTAGIWMQVLGGKGDVKGDGNGSGSDYSSTAFIAGYDAMVSPDWLMGVAVGYGKTQWDADVPATGNVDTPYAALYGRYSSGPWQIRLNGGLADNRFDTTRTVTIGAASSQARSKHNGQEWSAAAEAEYALTKAAGWEVRPLGAIRYAYLDEEGFNESGSPAALKIKGRSTQQANLGIGSRFIRTFDSDNGVLELRAMVTHLAGDKDSPVTASFVGGNSTFNVNGTPLRRTSLVLGAGLSHQVSNKLAAFADLGYETRGNGQTNSVAAIGIQIKW